ncbi:MAG: putative conserved integral rane protein [Thermoleophilia bacterium]|nr:putative conserved integral rane protein [Thermoleophilia bacterium]
MTATTSPTAPTPGISRDEWLRLARLARLLSWASLVIIAAEGVVGIGSGIAAGSIALIGFGIDSVIEGLASLVIVWRFSGARLTSETAELRAQRLVAAQFFILAPYITIQATRDLIVGHHPDVSIVGICLAVASLISMPLLGRAKQRIGRRMGSVATEGEGAQNILCAYMAAALLVGLGANALFGLWWLDPAAGLVIAALAIREGIEAWRGESCCMPSPAAATEDPNDCCSAC